jgi:hypothetical protein
MEEEEKSLKTMRFEESADEKEEIVHVKFCSATQ